MAEAQTDPIHVQSVTSQSYHLLDQMIQTEPEPEKPFKLGKPRDWDAFSVFLREAERRMSDALLENIKSTAFDGYTVKWEDDVTTIDRIYKFRHDFQASGMVRVSGFLEDQEELPSATGLSWSSTGSSLAVSYGRTDHDDWCTHKGFVCVWYINSKDLQENKAEVVLESASCVMCVAFHPTIPSLLAGGTFNGEIIVWNIAKREDNVVGNTRINEYSHQEPVSQVAWVSTSGNGPINQLLSSSTDGKLLLWDISSGMASPIKMAQLHLNHLKRPMGLGSLGSGKGHQISPVGVTGFSYPKGSHGSHVTQLIMGSEGGAITRAQLESFVMCPADGPNASVIVPELSSVSPVSLQYESHQGHVQSVACAPWNRYLFATCGSDGSIKVFNMHGDKSILNLEPSASPLLCMNWSLTRPAVIGVGSSEGNVYLYDLMESTVLPVKTLELRDGRNTDVPILDMAFNGKRQNYLAVADAEGFAHVWRLNSDLVRPLSNEQQFMDNLASSGQV